MLRKKRKNKSPKAILFDKAWEAFSRYIRARDKGICFTCGKKGNQAGHFIHGKNKPIYFNPYNVNCQCVSCNYFTSGNRDVYLRQVQRKYGIKKGDWLLAQRFKTKEWKMAELGAIIKKYTNLTKEKL